MAIDYAALKAEILADAEGRGYAAPYDAGLDAEVARLLNERAFIVRQEVAWERIWAYVDRSGLWVKIKRLATNPEASAAAQECAEQAIDTRRDRPYPAVDVDSLAFRGFVAALVAEPLLPEFTVQTEADILALADTPASRAEVLWGAGTVVSPTDVAQARGA